MNQKKKYLKDRFHEAHDKSMANGNKNTVFTMEMLYALHEMAVNDVYPDGRFGDDMCNVWSMMRR